MADRTRGNATRIRESHVGAWDRMIEQRATRRRGLQSDIGSISAVPVTLELDQSARVWKVHDPVGCW
jgi:hypothetical protein